MGGASEQIVVVLVAHKEFVGLNHKGLLLDYCGASADKT